jgi:pilus assembly protein CpaD
MKTNRARVMLALASALLLGACAPVTEYSAAEAPKDLVLDSSTTRLDLRFGAGTAWLSPGDAIRLRDMAASGKISPSDRVFVSASGAPRLAEQRVGAVTAQLLRYGIIASPTQLAQLPPNYAIVEVTRTLVTLPPCPNWSKPSASDFGNQPSSNHGCATEVNLGMMVANPADLASGIRLGPAAGQPAAAAVNRYLNDKVTPLPQAGTAAAFSSSASASTAAPSTGSP